MPPTSKIPPPRGCTGADGRWPSKADVYDWCATQPDDCNVALRLPTTVIGLDIDQYGAKHGWDNLINAARQQGLSSLPRTWRSSARGEPSGIYLYRVPDGIRLRSVPAPDVEAIQYHHRFAVVWPSSHPKGASPYRWYEPSGTVSVSVPRVDELPELPLDWLDFLRERAPETIPAALPPPEAHRETEWNPAVYSEYHKARSALQVASPGSRHEIARDRCMALCRMEQNGYAGATSAIEQLGARFVDAVRNDRTDATEAANEWARIVDGGRQLARTTLTAAEIARRDELAAQSALLPDDVSSSATEPQSEPPGPTWHPLSGGDWIFDAPQGIPAVWGSGDDVLWAEGEPFMLVAPPGVGKTTLMGQVVRGLVGLADEVLGQPVQTKRRVLLIAGDRPRQITRSYRRHFTPDDRETLNERLVVCSGPPPADLARHPELLVQMCKDVDADVVILDSMKDMAVGLTDDEVGAGVNRAIQLTIAAGIEVGITHHQRKGQNGAKPKTLEDVYGSTWLVAGAGSVVLLWGTAGDPIVELHHLKQPAGDVGPKQIEHDHDRGISSIVSEFDVTTYVRNCGSFGATVPDTARQMFSKSNPTDKERKKAERKLNALVAKGLAVKETGPRGGAGGSTPARYWLVGQGQSKDGSKDGGSLGPSSDESKTPWTTNNGSPGQSKDASKDAKDAPEHGRGSLPLVGGDPPCGTVDDPSELI